MLILRANTDITSLELRDLPTCLTFMGMLLYLHNLSSLLFRAGSGTLNKEKQQTESHKSRINVRCIILNGKLNFRMLQKVAVVLHSIDWSSSTCHANMGNCFGRTQIPSIELSQVFKRIHCVAADVY